MTTQSNNFNAQYIYDDENRLIAVIQNKKTSKMDFLYNKLGQLRSHWNILRQPPLDDLEFGFVHYIYNNFRVIQKQDFTNNPTISYTHNNNLNNNLEDTNN